MTTIRIGKATDNDCVLSAPEVSRKHAELILTDPTHGKLKDLGSTNGTFVNGKRITECEVKSGDTIRFGSVTTNLNDIQTRANHTVVPPAPQGKSYTIGRDPKCQITMPYDDVSHDHAVIYQGTDGSIYIEDHNSTNGTYVNGVKISTRRLAPGDRVEITRRHPLDWEPLFKKPVPPPVPTASRSNKTWIMAAAAVVILLVGCWVWPNFSTWSQEKVYDKYNTAVCLVYSQFGYKIYVDGQDFTNALCELANIKSDDIVSYNNGKLVSGPSAAQGTGFFIRDDGMIATNLHVARPWLYSEDAERIESMANRAVSMLSHQYPMLSRSKLKVVPVMLNMVVVPNGLPFTAGNVIHCTEYSLPDDLNKDVALLQTENRELPVHVEEIIDIDRAEFSDDALKEGRTVYTIGFPYGTTIGTTSNQEIRNQIHRGEVTQNRGEYEFGHDAATASGASGSPIINDRGRLVGIHHAGMTGATGAQGFNMGIKAKYIQNLLK